MFELMRGKNKNSLCGVRVKEGKYCKRHLNFEHSNNEFYKKEIFYCSAKSIRRQRCGRMVKKCGEYCFAHKKTNNNNEIQCNKNPLSLKFKSLVLFICLYASRKKKEKNAKDIKSMKCKDIVEYIGYDYIYESENQLRIKDNNFNIVITG